MACLLTLVFVLGLAGCGSGRRGGSDDDDDDSATDDDDSGDDDDVIDDDDDVIDDDDADPTWPPLDVIDQYVGCLVAITIDTDGDGATDVVGIAEYDDAGYWWLIEWDTDLDGSADQRVVRTMGPGHRLLEELSTRPDGQGAEQRVTYDYDGEGRLMGWEQDDGLDGLIDQRAEFVWSGGERTESWLDSNGDGSWNWARFYYYAGGDLVALEQDLNADGEIDYFGEVETTTAGEVELIEWRDASGEPSATATWTFPHPSYWTLYSWETPGSEALESLSYDSEWRLTESMENDGDGWVNQRRYSYDCF